MTIWNARVNRAFFVGGLVVVMGIQTTGKQEEYTAATGANITGDIDPDSGFDTARVVMGGGWRMPTEDECYELVVNTTHSWTTVNGTNGQVVTRPEYTYSYLFLSAAGFYRAGSRERESEKGLFWLAGYHSQEHAQIGEASSGTLTWAYVAVRLYALSVRGVLPK